MESDERSIRIQWEGDGKTSATAKYDEIKKYPSVVAGEERHVGEGRNSSRAQGALCECGPSGPSPQGVSHVRGNTFNRKTNIGADK